MATARKWRPTPRALALSLFGLTTVASALVAYPAMFRGFSAWDDEGYVLISLKEFLARGELYDEVFTQYGPFFFEFMGGLFSLGFDVSHDAGRLITIAVWLITSLLCGVVTHRMTGSLLLGLSAQLLVFRVLDQLRLEPLHPGGLLCLLLSCILAAVLLYPRRPKPAMFLIGAAAAGMALVKVNVGAFAVISIAFACVGSFSVLSRRRPVMLLGSALFVSTPFLLMAGDLDQRWVQEYALHVGVSALALVIIVGSQLPGQLSRLTDLAWLFAGMGVTVAGVFGVAVLTGTSPPGLIEGVLLDPLEQPDVFTAPFALPSWFLVWDALILGACFFYRWWIGSDADTQARWLVAMGVFRVGAGLAMLASLAGVALTSVVPFPELSLPLARQGNTLQAALALSLPLAWVAASGAKRGEAAAARLARLLLPALAVLQALHAYPVAGSQIAWSTFLLVPVGCVCISDGLRDLAEGATTPRSERASLSTRGVLLAGLSLVSIWASLLGPIRFEWTQYRDSVALALPGSGRVRLDSREAQLYSSLSQAIDKTCSSFVSLPGLNSFYLWARKEPPTGFNATAWMYIFGPARQRQVAHQAASEDRICAVRNSHLVSFWAAGRPHSRGPLTDFIDEGFTTVERRGGFELMVRDPKAGASP